MNKPITFQVDAEVADAFNQASSSQQQAIQSVISLWLKQMVQPESLAAITQEIRQEAASKGLTLDILQELLNDDKAYSGS
jgi:Tfp pilus assembly protein PilO